MGWNWFIQHILCVVSKNAKPIKHNERVKKYKLIGNAFNVENTSPH